MSVRPNGVRGASLNLKPRQLLPLPLQTELLPHWPRRQPRRHLGCLRVQSQLGCRRFRGGLLRQQCRLSGGGRLQSRLAPCLRLRNGLLSPRSRLLRGCGRPPDATVAHCGECMKWQLHGDAVYLSICSQCCDAKSFGIQTYVLHNTCTPL